MAVSDQTHSSVRNALHLLDMAPFLVPTTDHRFTGDSLRRALAERSRPEDVVAVVATAGTTNAGIVEDLAGIAEVAAHREFWFHVDGAYGGGALCSLPSARHLFAGIERADSFVVDPHKWLFAPFDCAALLYRDPALAGRPHPAGELSRRLPRRPRAWNPSDYAYHLTRRARGLALWFSLAVHGLDAYRTAVEAALAMATAAAARIDARRPSGARAGARASRSCSSAAPGWEAPDYHRWSRHLLAAQVGFVTPTAWEGETMARFAFLHPGTTVEPWSTRSWPRCADRRSLRHRPLPLLWEP